ncbi:hypothetical protein CBR_g41680 [Chara braunii]|uniref:Uncharacterized protein n=1 Tax=Chara braunii TaxID=69332 RepID=A0A388LWD8_CHABU|nr:hypothetical protein CBR_g41680 [Chara braunii]|eukprot:GBG86616.1 hypothetical protein CBR_g41680 [Chara braunii]
MLRQRLAGQGSDAGQRREEGGSRELMIVSEQGLRQGETGIGTGDQQNRRLRGDGVRRTEGRDGRQGITEEEGKRQVDPEDTEEEEEKEGDEDSPRDIQVRAIVRLREDQAVKDNLIFPFVCTLQGQEIYVLCVRTEDGRHVMPASNITEMPSPQFVIMKVRQLFSEQFIFRLFPEDSVTRISVDLPGGFKARYLISSADAHIPLELWMNIGSVNLVGIPLRLFLSDLNGELEGVSIEPGMTATLLHRLNDDLLKRRNLLSTCFAKVLSCRWPEALSAPGLIQSTTLHMAPYGEN